MSHSPFRILLLSTILLACVAAPSSAATSAQIHRDAADGSIDGSYSIAELRAADRAVSAEQREYFGWEDVYREHVRQLVMPAPAAARRPSRDSAPRARATTPLDKSPSQSDRNGTRGGRSAEPSDTSASAGSLDVPALGDERVIAAEPITDRPRRHKAAAAGLPLMWSLAAIPLVILAVGAWRMRRVRARAAIDRTTASQ